ncbi:hypothetical protein SAMN04488063_0011 [Halopelagius inordinatus]|uniref:Uncharacterized protein n=1 Tax=Halopelagius inordinatus TaxID=553467 RepID=A0A1I2WV61_9EURY|nr:hypothetical protein [Halopelagius inordinatus]SFH05132.1 hypothetical protein SAMN04488063_0011 [Halopelagius inordinatus]
MRKSKRSIDRAVSDLEEETSEEKGSLVKALVRMHEREKAEAAEGDEDGEDDE